MHADLKSTLYILSSVSLLALGQLFWKIGTTQAGQISFCAGEFLPCALKLFTNLWFAAGCILLLASSAIWVIALGMVDLGYAFPFQALAFVFIFLASWLIFKEPISVMRVIGIVLICAGVIFVARS